MKKSKYLIITVLVALYITSCNRLLPITKGSSNFKIKPTNKSKIFYQDTSQLILAKNIDSLVSVVENKLQLKIIEPIDIFLCSSELQFKNITGLTVRGVSFPPMGRIFINKNLQEEGIKGTKRIDVYLKHEISHSIIIQNCSFIGMFKFPRWLDEGLAMYSAHQFGIDNYYNKRQVASLIDSGEFYHPDWWRTPLLPASKGDKSFKHPNKIIFLYSEFGLIVEHLIEKYGPEKFKKYRSNLLKGKNERKTFIDVFGIEFEMYLELFKKEIIKYIENKDAREEN